MLWSLSGANAALIHYGFENFNLNEILDDSGNNINAVLVSGAHVTKIDSKCGAAVDLDGGELVIDNHAFHGRQLETITVAMWVKLRREEDNLSLFNIDSGNDGQGAVIVLEVSDGKIHWSHLDYDGTEIFNLLTNQRGSMPQGLWTHVAATYDSHKGQAKLFVDTQLIMSVQGAGHMSSRFHGKISISKDGTLPGTVDEFYLFGKPLSFSDITDLSELCDIGSDYQIPMDKGAYTAIQPHTQVKAANKFELGHRHSNIELNMKPDRVDTDSIMPDRITPDRIADDQCKRQAVLYSSDLRGGKTSGTFSDVGDTLTIDGCIRKCCSSPRCHVAYFEKKRCYNVICDFPSLCQPVKAGRALVTLGYVVRNGNSVYQPEPVTTIPPTIIIHTQPPTLPSRRPGGKHTCLQSMVYYGVALRGGWTSGKFSDMGFVPSLKKCIELCCKDLRCDLVMLLSQKCFTIHCYNLQDCQAIPNGHAQIAYVTRDQMSSAMQDPFPPPLAPLAPAKATHRPTHPTHRVEASVKLTTPSIDDKTYVPSMSGKRSDMILHLSFERIDDIQITDDSGFANNAKLTDDVNISPDGGIRGNGVLFQGGEILLDGPGFSPKPEKAITIALWVKLNVVQKKHSLFTVIGKDHRQSYYFEIVNRRIIWKHINKGERLFSAETGPILNKFIWHHIAVTYDSDNGEVKIYVDGKIQSIGIGHGLLSQNWGKRVGFGVYEEGRALDGFMDEIYMYNTALYGEEIGRYIRSFKEKRHQPSNAMVSVTRRRTRRVSSTHRPTHRPTHTPWHKPTRHLPHRPTHHATPKWGHGMTTEHPRHPTEHLFTGTIPGMTLGPSLTKRPKGRTTRIVTKKRTTRHRTTRRRTKSITIRTTTKTTTKPTTTPTTTTTKTTTTTTTSTTTTTVTTTTPTMATTTTQPKSFLTIKSPTESSSICIHGPTYKYADLRGGLSAGNFLDRGLTNGISTCMDLCCEHKTCDLAYVMSNRCYLVECFAVDMCGIVPKGVNMVSPVIGMVKRPDSPKIPELSDFVQIRTTTTPRSQREEKICKFGNVLNHTAFVGGLRAGNFSNKGQVTAMETCQDLCCRQKSCDVAVMMKHTCFLVACRNMDLCKPRPAQLDRFSLLLSYRDRKFEEDEQVIELLKGTIPPTTIATTTTTTTPKQTTRPSTTTAATTTPHPTTTKETNQMANGLIKPIGQTISTDNTSIVIPEPLKPNKNVLSWCLPSFIVEGVELRGGLSSGPYYMLGPVNSMDVCMKKCCEIQDCTTAYFDSSVCYAIRCLDKEQCKAKISGPLHKVGYVMRNGWSLFKKNNEVLQDATISIDTTTTTTTTPLPFNPLHRNKTQVGNMFNLPLVGLPTQPPDNIGYCKPKEKLVDHRLIGGMKSGIFTEHGTVNSFDSCIRYCCLDRLCDLAYQVGLTCYSIKCYNADSCRTFSVPKFFLNPVIAFVTRDPNEPMNIGASNTTVPTKKHPYNVMLKLQEMETLASETKAQQSPEQDYVKIVPEKPDQDYIVSTENVSPNGEQHDLGTKRQQNLNSVFKKLSPNHRHNSHIVKSKKNKKKTGKQASLDWTKSKKKGGKFRINKKKHKKKEVQAKKKSKTADIANIFSSLLGEDASGSGEQFDMASGSGLAERIHRLESNLVHTFQSKHLLADDKKKKGNSNRHSKNKKSKGKSHSLAEKKNKQNRPDDDLKKRFGNGNESLSQPFGTTKHVAMEDVDIDLIQALSPEFSDCDPVKYQCEHYCIALYHGGFRCICKEGYTLALDGKHCLYEGACNAHAHHCDQKCKYANDGIECSCRSGFVMRKGHNHTCEDMDECAMGINGCSDTCINTQGSYICECSHGFVLGQDRMSCEAAGAVSKKSEIARPEEPKFSIPAMIIASPNNTIINQSHNMLLQCKSFGYPAPSVVWTYGDNFTQPLQADTRFTFLPDGLMLLQSAYVNDSGRYTCVSSNVAGTDIAHVEVKVNDIDECLSGDNYCQQECQNTNGSYKCNCYNGYALDDNQYGCQDVDECNYAGYCDQFCWNTPGSYICGCRDGYTLDVDKRHCQDIDECAETNRSRCSQVCNNTLGTYNCACFDGYQLTADNKTCEKLPPKLKQDQTPTIHRHQYRSASSYIFLSSCIIITVAVLSGALMYLIRNYKKRWKLDDDDPNKMYAPPVSTRANIIYSWEN